MQLVGTTLTRLYAADKAVDTPAHFRAIRLSYDTSEQNTSPEKRTSVMNRSVTGPSIGRIIYAAMNEWFIHIWYIMVTLSTALTAMLDGYWESAWCLQDCFILLS